MRFQTDARFKRPQEKDVKLELDSRFKDVLKKDFYEAAPVDKYGRAGNEEGDFMKKQFQYEIESESESSLQEEVEEDPVIEMIQVLDQEDIEMGDCTKRIGLVNIDWDNVKAEDIYMLMDSFTKESGDLVDVIIFQSEFGKERMSSEELDGPPKIIFNEDENSENPFNMPELRKYQLERMRYYFCIITFKSVEIAQSVFNACDGQELELTSNALDLRYVPNDVEFTDSKIKAQCVEKPLKYEPLHFETKALQHSNIKLTWDKDEIERQKMVKKLQNGDLEDASHLIASCSEGENEFGDLDALKSDKSDAEELKLDIQFQPKFENSGKHAFEADSSDDDDANHFDMRDVVRSSKTKVVSKWKKRKVEKLVKAGKIDASEADRMVGRLEDKFEVDVKDQRFQDMFANPEFHIDKLDSHFVQTKNSNVIMKELEDSAKPAK